MPAYKYSAIVSSDDLQKMILQYVSTLELIIRKKVLSFMSNKSLLADRYLGLRWWITVVKIIAVSSFLPCVLKERKI